MFLDLCTNLRIKGLLTAGFYGTPEFDFISSDTPGGGGRRTESDFKPGIDLRIDYRFNHFFIGTNFLYSMPGFEVKEFTGNPLEIGSVANIGILAGYIF